MDLLTLMATLGLDASSYEEGLDSAQQRGSSFASSFNSAVTGAMRIGTGAIIATGAALAGTSVAFAKGISDVAAYGDNIDKMSQKMGLSTEAYQEWDAVMQHAGTSIETMKASMKTLANAAESDNEAFQRLGITQEQIASMSQEELFEATIAGLQNVEDTTERTYLAGQLLGRGATELGPLLNMTAEETQQMRDRVHELGGVMSQEAVSASAAYQDSLQDLQTSFSGLRNNLLSDFLPSITTVMDGLAEIFIGNDEEGLAMIEQGVDDFIENLTSVLPRFIEVGGRILTSIVSAIMQNLPTLLESGKSVLNELIQGIITNLPYLLDSAVMLISMLGSAILDNLPLIIDTGLDLLMSLMQGITENAPTVIPAIVSVITEMIRVLTSPENLELFIHSGLELILAIADGLVASIPDLVAVIPEIIANYIVVMEEMFPEIIDALLLLVGDLAVALLEALASLMGTSFADVEGGLSSIGEAISGAFENIKQWFQDLWDNLTEKVSSLWEDITGFFSDGLENAKETVESVLNTISETFSSIFDTVKETVSGAIDYIKGLFDFEWSLPDLKLPHFSITGALDLMANPPSVPKVSIDWYKKGYSDAYILNGATIFGAQGGSLLGGGEGAGSEVIVGTSKLVAMMTEAVKSANMGEITIINPIYIGDEKLDEVINKANKRSDFISGGR